MVYLKAPFKSGSPEWCWDGFEGNRLVFNLTKASTVPREMECPTTRNDEKKSSRLSQAATSFGGGSVSIGGVLRLQNCREVLGV